ncbi:MAG: hypothetical protein QG657_3222, partial [Acidobacteriota bacterium]|nr:hypothetical protein [Acidobacteriota bacterium]
KDFNGLFCIIQAMESCPSFNPKYDKEKKHPYLAYKERQCLHYYFYFIDDYLGLCFIRVPTWLPLRLKVYFNGHNWLASRLDEEKIKYQMLDNCFPVLFIENFERAQQISDSFDVKKLHQFLDKFAQTYCPIFKDFCNSYHWSVLQAEYSTDIVFRRQKDLQGIYQNLVATADKKGMSPMDVVAVLTKVLQEQQRVNQEQQKVIADLQERLAKIEKK